MLSHAVGLHGHEVTLATRGAEGLDLARGGHPDVVICDLGLPEGVTGFDVAKAMRADVQTRDIPLIAISGYARPEDQERGRLAGFDVHLTKPVSIDEILRVIGELSG
ncbi:twitching motility response regulator PilH [soil metagenome]